MHRQWSWGLQSMENCVEDMKGLAQAASLSEWLVVKTETH